MTAAPTNLTIGVLASGGLDSSILVAQLLRQGRHVRPFYVRSGLYWETEELSGLQAFLGSLATPRLEKLVVLDLPLVDLYGHHWSIDGRNAPDAQSADDAVYLPGRNALLLLKPAIWCAMHGIGELALAVLASNPFADATDGFFVQFEEAIHRATGSRIRFARPFANLDKKDVLGLGQGLSLELTFSCIAPVNGLHCGRCNKCAERQRGFRSVGFDDRSRYAGREGREENG
jgi:7-cyano-7-deazaguanine synthase